MAAVVRKVVSREALSSLLQSGPRDQSAKLSLFGTVTYVVVGVVLREGKVLMMQEAKRSCRGRWYLPAGRMEAGETVEEGVRREVMEETGLEFQPKSIICVEVRTHYSVWVRFTVVGEATGGTLKTLESADGESLQAGWYSANVGKLQGEIPLRAPDILPLIEMATAWKSREAVGGAYHHLPLLVPHPLLSLSVLAVSRESTSAGRPRGQRSSRSSSPPRTHRGKLNWLHRSGSKVDPPLLAREVPLLELARTAITDLAKKLVTDEGVRAECWLVGMLSMEHSGGDGSDGLHLDLLVEVSSPSGGVWEAVPEGEEHQWLVKRLDRDGGCIHFVDLNR